MKNTNKALLTVLSGSFALAACLIANSAIANEVTASTPSETTTIEQLASVEQVLKQVHHCNKSITIRSQALSRDKVATACHQLIAQEDKFHQIFNSRNKPVDDDINTSLRANFYSSNAEYVKYATEHFNMPTNNGGMYLEGYPERQGTTLNLLPLSAMVVYGIYPMNIFIISMAALIAMVIIVTACMMIMLVLNFALYLTRHTRTAFGGLKVLPNILLGVKITPKQYQSQARKRIR